MYWLPYTCHIPHRHPAFFKSLMPLKNWCSIHARWSKSSLKHFCSIFPCLKKIFIAYRSSKVSSRPDHIFEIPQLWQLGCIQIPTVAVLLNLKFKKLVCLLIRYIAIIYWISRVYDNLKCLNKKKKVWKLIECTPYIVIQRQTFSLFHKS